MQPPSLSSLDPKNLGIIALSTGAQEPGLNPQNILDLNLEKKHISLKEPITIIDISSLPTSYHPHGNLLLSNPLSATDIQRCKNAIKGKQAYTVEEVSDEESNPSIKATHYLPASLTTKINHPFLASPKQVEDISYSLKGLHLKRKFESSNNPDHPKKKTKTT